MKEVVDSGKAAETKPIHIRKLTKAGGSRYLSVGKIVPVEWVNIKIVVEDISNNSCLLRLTPIL